MEYRLILFLFFVFFFGVFGVEQSNANDADRIGAEFTKTILNMDDYSWDALGDETVPLEQQHDEVMELLYHLVRVIPPSFLKQNAVKPFPNLSVLVSDPAQFRGRVFELRGHVVFVREIPLNPVEQKRFRIPSVFRCRFCVDEQYFADVLTSFVPAAWKRNEPIHELATVTGIYLKRLVFPESEEIDFIPFLVAHRFQWYPETFLGSFGFDVGSFDQVPLLRIADLKKKRFDVVPSLRLLGRQEIIQRAFKLTVADREPFYGLLQAVSQIPTTRLRQEARRILEQKRTRENVVTDLFNDPAKMRGQPVLLHGIAKQVLPTLVEDKEVEFLFGVKKYYQIYFYTKESRGNPLVVCVPSLPEGMPVGAAADYAETITITAIPYKLWIYETSAKLEGGSGYKPNYAPLLVGNTPIWHPKKQPTKTAANTKIQNTQTTISITLFFLLLLTWMVMRRFQTKKAIRFSMDKSNTERKSPGKNWKIKKRNQ
ncbi:MAG: hypothetical protein LBI18_14000 [Planctomycetaceae bacterium]|jgi:hypothetical protein|nr:hypothetical protein [Planctomycetaceae bacterium]